MPILPLDHPEPFAATLGVMLYPGEDEAPKARAYAAHWLAQPFRQFTEGGHELTYDALARVFADGGEDLSDADARWSAGLDMGALLLHLFALYCSDPALASWEKSIRISKWTAARSGLSSSRSKQFAAKSRFTMVAHLWAALLIREGRFETRPDVGYDGYTDFQFFLAEADILRDWGQTCRPRLAKSKPFLPPDVWRVPDGWSLPAHQPDWPETGRIRIQTIAPEIIETLKLKPAGRPRRLV